MAAAADGRGLGLEARKASFEVGSRMGARGSGGSGGSGEGATNPDGALPGTGSAVSVPPPADKSRAGRGRQDPVEAERVRGRVEAGTGPSTSHRRQGPRSYRWLRL